MPTSSRGPLAWVWNYRQRRLRAIPRLVLHALLAILMLIIAIVPLYVGLAILGFNPDGMVMNIVGGSVQTIVMILSIWLAGWLLDRRTFRIHRWELALRSWRWSELAAGFAMGAMVMIGIFALEWSLGWVQVVAAGARPDTDWPRLLFSQLGWLTLMIGVGWSEELLSRGYHLKNMAEGLRWLGVWPAVVLAVLLSSVFFGVLHMGNPNATAVSTTSIAMAGVMLAIARVTTGSLAAPIGLHISWNYFQGPLLGFPVSGNVCEGSFVEMQQLGDPLWTGGEFGPEAGLLGIAAMLLLCLVFIAWGVLQGKNTKHAARLARYGQLPPRPVLANGLGHRSLAQGPRNTYDTDVFGQGPYSPPQ